MANEITAVMRLEVNNSPYDMKFAQTRTFDQTGTGAGTPGVVSLTTAESDVSFGAITPGFTGMLNLSTANTVQFGPKDTTMTLLGQLSPQAFCLFEMSTAATLRMRTTASTAVVQIFGVEV